MSKPQGESLSRVCRRCRTRARARACQLLDSRNQNSKRGQRIKAVYLEQTEEKAASTGNNGVVAKVIWKV